MINELIKDSRINRKYYSKLPLAVLRHTNNNSNSNHIKKHTSPLNDKMNSFLINNLYYNLITRNSTKPIHTKVYTKPTVVPITKYPIKTQSSQNTYKYPTPRFTPFKEYSYQEDKNTKEYMEYFHSIIPKLNRDPAQAFFAIFDRHGGRTTAVFCKDNFGFVFGKYMKETNGNVEKSIKSTFTKINNDLLEKLKDYEQIGSAVTMIYISINSMNKRTLYSANVGNSKVYLLKKSGECIKITKEPTCKAQNDVEHIKQNGGYGIISEPYITHLNIDNTDNCIILASDGIWDIIDEKKLSIFAREDMPSEALCKRLVKMSLEGGSKDNLSCIVIKL